MRVAGRLMQLERLEHAATDEHFQGNQASLPIDLVELVRHYEQVTYVFQVQKNDLTSFLKVGSLSEAQSPSSDEGDSSFALFSLMLFFFMLNSWRRMRNHDRAPEYVDE
jgi:hypothetical protein